MTAFVKKTSGIQVEKQASDYFPSIQYPRNVPRYEVRGLTTKHAGNVFIFCRVHGNIADMQLVAYIAIPAPQRLTHLLPTSLVRVYQNNTQRIFSNFCDGCK
jgi:hypothetical protein